MHIAKQKLTTTAAMRREENEAASRMLGEDYAEFRTKCDQIRKLLSKMKQDEDQPNPELKSEVALLMTDLKQLNRSDKFRTKWGRDSVNAVKCKVDSFYLKLQNLLYEVVFVQKEIKRSLDYKSKADDVDLEDLHTVLSEISDNITQSVS
jgi:THO complex subunit 5